MKKNFFLLLTLLVTFSWRNLYAGSGVLFIAHGTMNHNSGQEHISRACMPHHYSPWEQFVLSTLGSIKNEIPKNFEVAFGMWESHCFDEAIERLEAKLLSEGSNLDHLIVFPLFISSHSEVIEMQKYIFKKRPDHVLPIPGVRPTKFNGQITYMNALDYDPHVSLILSNRFHQLVHMAKARGFNNKQMELVLLMHGPVDEISNIEWIKMGERYAKDVNYLFPVAASHIISLRDDAEGEVRDRMTEELRSKIKSVSVNGKVALLLPLLVSKGGIEGGILERVKGLDYIWSGHTLFPDPKLADVIVSRLQTVIKK
ncbi:MAG: hypothetical protein NDI69_14220 [Bacteriovoracaceae bacterium]|nr:hypothetical protein [Bacteriovoracaceae bacterium]